MTRTSVRRWRAELDAAPDHVAVTRVALAGAAAFALAALSLFAALALAGCAAGSARIESTSPQENAR
jgi:hypothetical protein